MRLTGIQCDKAWYIHTYMRLTGIQCEKAWYLRLTCMYFFRFDETTEDVKNYKN